jgi:chaperone modulatory protein CbpM
MIDFDALVREIEGLDAQELRQWIAEHWVRAEESDRGFFFHEVDAARVRLIRELRHELAIGDEAIPVILQLLDQVYALRRRLRRLCQAIEAQPLELRDAVRTHLAQGRSEEGE